MSTDGTKRSIDGAAVATMALGLPWFLGSLAVVGGLGAGLAELSGAFAGWLLAIAWVTSGALVFWPVAEAMFAQYLLGGRRPLPDEQAVLGPMWQAVCDHTRVDGTKYSLWIEDSSEVNAYASAGHIVMVTTRALRGDPQQMSAVLAHELGHHAGGHAWSGLLMWWYSLPARFALRLALVLLDLALYIISIFSYLAYLLAVVALIVIAVIVIGTLPFLLLLPLIPFVVAIADRRAELRADQFAVRNGYGPWLLTALQEIHHEETISPRPGPLARALASHPSAAQRIDALYRMLPPPSGRSGRFG